MDRLADDVEGLGQCNCLVDFKQPVRVIHLIDLGQQSEPFNGPEQAALNADPLRSCDEWHLTPLLKRVQVVPELPVQDG